MNGEQAAQTITVCAPQQVSIPEGVGSTGHMPRADTKKSIESSAYSFAYVLCTLSSDSVGAGVAAQLRWLDKAPAVGPQGAARGGAEGGGGPHAAASPGHAAVRERPCLGQRTLKP